MECPKCKYDLSKLENYCNVDLYLDYDHVYIEKEKEIWDLYNWILKEEKEVTDGNTK